jgi:hypothetical protein
MENLDIALDSLFNESLDTAPLVKPTEVVDKNSTNATNSDTTKLGNSESKVDNSNTSTNTSNTEDIGESEAFTLMAKNLLVNQFGVSETELADIKLNNAAQFDELVKDFVDESIRHNVDAVLSNPIVRELYEFTKNGGDFKDWLNYYTNPFDPSTAKVDTREQQLEITKLYLENTTELDDKAIATMLRALEEDGSLEERSLIALGKLQQMQIEQAKQAQAAQQRELQQEKEQAEREIQHLRNLVLNGSSEVLGADLTPEMRTKFWEFIEKPIPELGNITRFVYERDRLEEYNLKNAVNLFLGFTSKGSKDKAALNLAQKSIVRELNKVSNTASSKNTFDHIKAGTPEEYDAALKKFIAMGN